MAANHLFDGLLGGRESAPGTLLRVPGGESWSYADTVELSGRLANLLVELGVTPGDRVAVQVQKSPQAIALYLATVRAGAVFLPLNTAYTRNEVGYFLDDAEPALLVCDGARAAEFDGIDAQLMTLDGDGGGSLASAATTHAAAFDNVERLGIAAEPCSILTAELVDRSDTTVILERAICQDRSGKITSFAEVEFLAGV